MSVIGDHFVLFIVNAIILQIISFSLFSVIVLNENDDSSTCRADQVKHSKIFSNRTLAGGLEAGSFKFLGKFKYVASASASA